MKAATFYGQLIEALRAVPGVRDAAVSSGIPFGAGNYTTTPIATSGGPSPLAPETAVPTDWRVVSPGFFRTMEIPLLRGREFTDADGPAAPQVMVVSQATAQRFFGDDNPLGRRFHRVADSREFAVVGDVRHTALNQESPAIYYSTSTGRLWPLMDASCAPACRRHRSWPACARRSASSIRSCRSRTCGRCRSRCRATPRSRG
jgi:putative ABC transport system permease protein